MPLPASSEASDYSGWDDDEAALAVPVADDEVVLVAGDEGGGERLDKWLAGRMPAYSRSRLQRWIGDGRVTIDARTAGAREPVWRGARVVVRPLPGEDETAFVAEDVALHVVYEDDAILVLDKRPGLVVHPAAGNWHGTVLNGLLRHDAALAAVPRAGIVHRLDKDTSGLMVVARTITAQTDLVRQLQARTVGRTYVAIVHGTSPATGRVDWPIGRDPRDRTRMAAFRPERGGTVAPRPGTKPAATRFETLATTTTSTGATTSFVVCRLETGRTHQIRVHLQALGHPLVGDATYGGARGGVNAPVPFARQALHAWRLALVHPVTHEPLAWRAELPPDLAALAADLGFDAGHLLANCER